MEITIFAGKGGVGKSTLAIAYALHLAENERVLAVDYDGGHSLNRVLSIEKQFPSNKICSSGISNLEIDIIDPISFQAVDEAQEKGVSIKEYIKQFPGDYGLIPFCDMIMSFFGAPTDIISTSKYASVIEAYYQIKEGKTRNMIIDVEPTEGLERLLSSVKKMTKSLDNLKNTNKLVQMAINYGWPDISEYLKEDYIQNTELYSDRMIETTEALKKAKYYVVCNPESSPIDKH